MLAAAVATICLLLTHASLAGAQGRPRPKPEFVSIADAPLRGAPDAPVTIVEFSDYECAFFAQHARETMPRIVSEYITTGKVKYVVRNFPLMPLHLRALRAVEAALCARDQDKYWQMHDRLFAGESSLSDEDLVTYARAIDVDPTAFQNCLGSRTHAPRVKNDLDEGKEAGVTGTPTFIIGFATPNNQQVRVTSILRGIQPYETFQRLIDGLHRRKLQFRDRRR